MHHQSQFAYLDRLLTAHPPPQITLDLGTYIETEPDKIVVVAPDPATPLPRGVVTKYMLLHGCEENNERHGTVFFHDAATGERYKFYSALAHVIKGGTSRSFMTVPKTVKMSRHRMNEMTKFLELLNTDEPRSRYARRHSCRVRAEITIKMTTPFAQILQTANDEIENFLAHLHFSFIDFDIFVQNIEKAIQVANTEGLGRGTNVARLSYEKQRI